VQRAFLQSETRLVMTSHPSWLLIGGNQAASLVIPETTIFAVGTSRDSLGALYADLLCAWPGSAVSALSQILPSTCTSPAHGTACLRTCPVPGAPLQDHQVLDLQRELALPYAQTVKKYKSMPPPCYGEQSIFMEARKVSSRVCRILSTYPLLYRNHQPFENTIPKMDPILGCIYKLTQSW